MDLDALRKQNDEREHHYVASGMVQGLVTTFDPVLLAVKALADALDVTPQFELAFEEQRARRLLEIESEIEERMLRQGRRAPIIQAVPADGILPPEEVPGINIDDHPSASKRAPASKPRRPPVTTRGTGRTGGTRRR